jgi:hypothetical protein
MREVWRVADPPESFVLADYGGEAAVVSENKKILGR